MMTFPFQRPFVIGVVHLAGTPGSPDAVPTSELLGRAAADARALADGGVDGLIVENFGDRPFHPERVPPETIATLALAVARVRNEAGSLPVGVNVLRNDARAALGLCAATGAEFLRVNVHTGAMVTDQGLIQGRAHETHRERQRLAPDAALLADVHVKHAAPLADMPIEVAARDLVERGMADGVVVSGSGTGHPASLEDLRAVREAIGAHPLVLGSGLTLDSVSDLFEVADGAIVGTSLKEGGRVEAPVDRERVAALVGAVRRA